MKNENRIIEILAEVVKKQDVMAGDIASIRSDVTGIREEMVKHNLQIAENSRAVLKLADEMRLVVEHEKRISKLEHVVFK
jgi:hypothetical protein